MKVSPMEDVTLNIQNVAELIPKRNHMIATIATKVSHGEVVKLYMKEFTPKRNHINASIVTRVSHG